MLIFKTIISKINKFRFISGSSLKFQKNDFIKYLVSKYKINTQLFKEFKKYQFFNKRFFSKAKK